MVLCVIYNYSNYTSCLLVQLWTYVPVSKTGWGALRHDGQLDELLDGRTGPLHLHARGSVSHSDRLAVAAEAPTTGEIRRGTDSGGARARPAGPVSYWRQRSRRVGRARPPKPRRAGQHGTRAPAGETEKRRSCSSNAGGPQWRLDRAFIVRRGCRSGLGGVEEDAGGSSRDRGGKESASASC